jgi:hypothetical protein
VNDFSLEYVYFVGNISEEDFELSSDSINVVKGGLLTTQRNKFPSLCRIQIFIKTSNLGKTGSEKPPRLRAEISLA